MIPAGSDTLLKRKQRSRKLRAAPVIVLLAALVGGPVALAGKASLPVGRPGPTADLPLPVTESPITFHLSDQAGYWFDNARPELEPILHTRSLSAAVAGVPTKINFSIGEPYTSMTHTISSIVWPVGAKHDQGEAFPYLQQGSFTGPASIEISDPGLYVFQCRVHPYMVGAVVLDDPATVGADLGKKVHWIDGTEMATADNEILQIVRDFFILSEPANWQYYAADRDTTWDPEYPVAPVLTYQEDGTPFLIPNLDAFYQRMFNEPITLKAPVKPTQPGVGEVWVDTQFEKSASKDKPGSMTAFDTTTWDLTKKLFLPSINLNNPHNIGASRDQNTLYQSQWFSNKVTAVDRETGKEINTIEVGPSPSHVMRRPQSPGSGTLIVPNNGGNRVVEISTDGPRLGKIEKSLLTQAPGKGPALPHAHWVSFDGKNVVTPNSNETTLGLFNVDMGSLIKPQSGEFPVASSMTNDGKRAYVANLLDHTIRCFSIEQPACPNPGSSTKSATNLIDLRQNYNKVTGETTGPYGLSPIQLPISPDDKYMLVVGTFSSNVLVIDIANHKIVKSLACAPGCHGINFGAKKGGGYYGYVSIKFANKFMVVDGDPNGDGDFSDAKIAGEMITSSTPTKILDDTPSSEFGQGGQGVWAIPEVYNGWVQELPASWKAQLTCKQQEPLKTALC